MNLVGKNIGRYHVLEQLGQGGMAIVYKAYDTRLERDVAIKVIRTDAFPPAILERVLKRFEREAKALAKLDHPNIVAIYDYGEYEGAPYLVMPYLPGGTLKQRMGKPVSEEEAVRLILPIAQALSYAHEHGILHRDVKPSNILIGSDGVPRLGDFGIGKLLEQEDGHTLTGTGVGVGTPEYMAPEQGLGRNVDARADVYSLGIVLYELVTGRKPYTADTPMAVVVKHLNDPLPRPRSFNASVSEEMERVLFKALAKKIEDRYGNMCEFDKALKDQVQINRQVLLSGETKVANDNSRPTLNFQSKSSFEWKDAPILFLEKQEKPTVIEINEKKKKNINDIPGSEITKRAWNLKVGAILLGFLFIYFIVKDIQTQERQKNAMLATELIHQKTEAAKQSASEKRIHLTQTAQLLTKTQIWKKDDMEMVYVREGEFEMGAEQGNRNEKPVHSVYLNSYWIDKFEVTNAQYQKCVDDGICRPSRYYGENRLNNANQPVVGVRWYYANVYCKWVDKRLPTEAEWEKAARGVDAREYPWGNHWPEGEYLNWDESSDGFSYSAPVGSFPAGASPYGVLDLAGNVREWVADCYSEYPEGQLKNPIVTSCTDTDLRVIRGGSYLNYDYDVRSTVRDWNDSSHYDYDIGFRCAISETETSN